MLAFIMTSHGDVVYPGLRHRHRNPPLTVKRVAGVFATVKTYGSALVSSSFVYFSRFDSVITDSGIYLKR